MTISIKNAKNDSIQKQDTVITNLNTILDPNSTVIDNHVDNLNVKPEDKDFLKKDYFARLKALNIQKSLIFNHVKIAEDIQATFNRDLKTMENSLQLYKKYDSQ